MPEWFVRRGDQVRGPLTTQELKRLVANGTVVASDLLRTADKLKWRKAESISGLFESEVTTNKPVPPPLPKTHTPVPLPSSIKVEPSSSNNWVPIWQRLPLAAFLTVFCWPVGMLLVWLNPHLTRRSKWGWTGASLAGFLFLAILVPKWRTQVSLVDSSQPHVVDVGKPKSVDLSAFHEPSDISKLQSQLQKNADENAAFQAGARAKDKEDSERQARSIATRERNETESKNEVSPTDLSASRVGDLGQNHASSPIKAFSGSGPNGEKILKGDHGDNSGRFWHYYIDKKGEEVLHGPSLGSICCPPCSENSEYDHGVLKARLIYDTNGNLVESFARLSDGTYQRDEYRHTAGSTLQLRSTVSITKVDGGSEIKTLTPKVQVAHGGNSTSLPSVQGRSLKVSIGTAVGGDMERIVKQHNASLQSVKCVATDGQLVIDFDVDTSQWSPVARKFPLLLRLFDKNGNYLAHFRTAEGFTVHEELYQRYKKGYENISRLGDAKEAAKRLCELLKPTGNRVAYQISVRDLRDSAIVEIGFTEPEKW